MVLFLNTTFVLLAALESSFASNSHCVNTVRAIAHGIARDEAGHIVRPVPYTGHGVVVDANALISMSEGRARSSEVAAYTYIKKIEKKAHRKGETFHVWVPDRVLNEMSVASHQVILPIGTRRIQLTVSRDASEYKSINQQLADLRVGEKRNHDGTADREILTDLFFTQTDGRVPVEFITSDTGILFPLCKLIRDCYSALSKSPEVFFDQFRSGFNVSLKDSAGHERVVKLTPIPTKK